MPDYLLEIGTEELPADQVPEAQERLKNLIADALKQANVRFDEVTTFGTPRRLTCVVHQIQPMQDTVEKKVAGPAVKASFDAAGGALPAAVRFAEKHGLSVEGLARETVGGVEKLVANLTIKGQPVGEVLKEIVPAAIMQLSGERLMRWGNGDMKFSRPIRWMVSLLDSEEVPVSIEGLKSGRATYGNRVLAPGTITIKDTGEYVESLRKARVLADPNERQETIQKQVKAVAAGVSGRPRQLSGPLLEEVVNITEWPHAVLGQFENEYLDLPDKLIETIMIHHQRYFPVEKADATDAKKKLLPYFITVSNNDRKEAEPIIKQGNERVIRARLADGRFFYFDDQKTKLADRKAKLHELTFQEGLGSYQEKTARLMSAASILIDSLRLEARIAVCLEKAVELCKLDLVTGLVRELPELQGYVGSWYAENEGQPPDVVQAIASHYAPRSQHDEIPADTVGQFAALIDKLDNLVGLFALGRRPSGSSDPYALRRQAQGVVDILVDGLQAYPVNVSALVELILEPIQPLLAKKKGFEPGKTIADVKEFILQRLRVKLQERGYKREVIDAVLNAYDPLVNMANVVVRCEVVQQLLDRKEGTNIIRAGVRIENILGADSLHSVDPAKFEVPAEKTLWDSFQQQVVSVWESDGHFKQPNTVEEYLKMLDLLGGIAKPIDDFFENVMVNDPDTAKKNNRHGMLKLIDHYYSSVADFRKLQPLLP